uniref:Uncharacterized protein n=1 Tax=Anguilla anguilla TaxID=7936 RepID=A0A0E9QZK9_ANGAN
MRINKDQEWLSHTYFSNEEQMQLVMLFVGSRWFHGAKCRYSSKSTVNAMHCGVCTHTGISHSVPHSLARPKGTS